jgi:hypothetical protein
VPRCKHEVQYLIKEALLRCGKGLRKTSMNSDIYAIRC